MDYKIVKEKMSYLESQKQKYGYLLKLTPEQLNKLKEKIKDYNKIGLLDYKGNLEVPKEFELILENNYINNKNITDKNKLQQIRILTEIELKKILTLKNILYNLMNTNYIFDYEDINKKIKNDSIIEFNKLIIFNTETNKEKINIIKNLYDKLNKIFSNKKETEKNILLKEKEIINNIDETINFICFKLNVDYKNKNFIEKYFEIINIIELKVNTYNDMLKNVSSITTIIYNIENNLTKEMESVGISLNLTLEQIKDLSEKNIDSIIEKIQLYENNSLETLTEPNKKIK